MTVQTTGTITVGSGGATIVEQPNGMTGEKPAEGAGETPRQESEQAETLDALPAWAQKQIKDLRQENERRRKAETENKRKADEEKLAAEARWQQLAEERGKEIDTLRQTSEKFDRLSQQLLDQAEREIAAWPEEVRSMKPEGDVEAILGWAGKARQLVAKLTQAAAPGQSAMPRPAGSAAGAADRAARQELERRVRRL